MPGLNQRLRVRSVQGKANILGHPIHLMLVCFPVAFWSGTLVTDLAGLITRDAFWYRVSYLQIVAGTATGALCVIPGFIDYFTVPMGNKARLAANRHWIWSLACLIFFVGGLIIRTRDSTSFAGIVLTSTGALALLAGAFFGSELVARYHVGIIDRQPAKKRGSNETIE
jgi:uncharacterized membrane protein